MLTVAVHKQVTRVWKANVAQRKFVFA